MLAAQGYSSVGVCKGEGSENFGDNYDCKYGWCMTSLLPKVQLLLDACYSYTMGHGEEWQIE